ncbi:MAG TPA: hypothetical protein VFC65_10565 [Prolixibacteraceae bacterium]|nr:hypothetical protein [Prolixibacteraceae bacterium]
MKTTTTLIFASLLALTFSVSNVYSQLVAIGHVSAEVVESVSAASAIVTNFEIGSATDSESKSIDLGAITIQSGKDIACNVVLKQASVSDALGNSFTLDASLNPDSASRAARSNGSQTIQLNGKANLSDNQASGLYQGSCTVIFAYN